jgi:TolB-like protein/Tfp pilus assembly protein PilF
MGGLADGTKGSEVTSQDRLALLWRRVREHKVVQWTAAYVAIAYGIQHGITLTSEAFEWPHAVTRVSMLLLVLSLPIAIIVAWYHGARANKRVSGAELSLISIFLLIGSLLFYIFVRPEQVAIKAPAQQTSVAALPKGAISVAVLPFVNLSSDKEQEFFSDGMTEEITAALAKVQRLTVIGRTSAFQFKGKNEDLRQIGQTLGVTHLIEGSVRKAGTRVRITAQLIRADTGAHLWTDSYDRELTDIFATQEDIAQAVAAALQVPLGLKQGERLVSNRQADTQSYEDYLRAKALWRGRGYGGLTEAVALMEKLLARQPNFAPGWALLAQAYGRLPDYDSRAAISVETLRHASDSALAKSEAAASRAIMLDARNAEAYAALGFIHELRAQLLDAEKFYKQALSIDPLNPDILHDYSAFIAATGRVHEAVPIREQLRSIEPLVPVFTSVTNRILWAAGDNAKALAIALALPADYDQRSPDLARIYAAMGRFTEAAQAIESYRLPERARVVARLLRNAPARPAENVPYLGGLSFFFVYVGLPERALENAEFLADAGYAIHINLWPLWQPDYRAARQTPRFKALVRKLGLVDYWRARGWPEFCRPTIGDDFECG